MATSLGIIMILGLFVNWFFNKINLPGLLGMLLLGILIGPYVLDWISPDLMRVSADFRQIALIIILLRAGLGIRKEDLSKVGKTALFMSFIPGLLEGFSIAFLSIWILNFSFIEGGILGFIVAAVSPAVVVPQMLDFQLQGIGKKRGIPTLILAGASIDDIFAITMFSAFLGLYSGSHMNIGIQILSIPLSIIFGIILGVVVGLMMVRIFDRHSIRDTEKVLLILGVAILLTALEGVLKHRVEIAGLLGVMTIGFILLERKPNVANRLAIKFNKIWIFAEILLFVLVGSQVNIFVAWEAGVKGLIIILVGLLGRSLGVIISTIKAGFNRKERLFCILAYIPKATVQAAIGAIPLSLGVKSGDIILAVAVLSIIITAPLGAIAIRSTVTKLLEE